MVEQWKTLEDFSNYEVSNLGKVRNIKTGLEIKSTLNSSGYFGLNLYDNGRRKAVRMHQLVANYFIPKIEGKNFVNHIDGNKQNNRLYNLEWCTPSENSLHSKKIIRNENQKRSYKTENIVLNENEKQEEQWKVVEGYSNYKISNFGRIINKNNQILKMNKNVSGYTQIAISNNNIRKTLLIHRLVAQAFIPEVEGKTHVNHIDGNKQNNRATNLEWVTPSENMKHAISTGINIGNKGNPQSEEMKESNSITFSKPVLQLDLETMEIIKEFKNSIEASKEVNTTYTSILNNCRGESNHSMGFKWCFKEEYNKQEFLNKRKKYLQNKIDNNPNPRVLQLDKDTLEIINAFDTLQDAADFFKCSRTSIGNNCRGESKYCMGFKFTYEGEEIIQKEASFRGDLVAEIDNNGNIIKEYKSPSDAANQLGLKTSNISRVARGERKSYEGRFFKYIKDIKEV